MENKAELFKKLAWVPILGFLIAGLVSGNGTMIALLFICGLVLGIIFFGLAEIMNLLHKIHEKLGNG
ncbi:hypothetical protein [Effusibacillus consociatus]|uniref:DUF2273 domain-containing protein n=1 Tax=Effusibacillus consociatus TaxID=1117041 RepID=A0ABV9PXP2_9BACL